MKRHEHGHFGWVDLWAEDVESQSAFYEGLFGWTHRDEPTFEGGPPYRMFAVEGGDVAAMSPLPPDMLDAGVPSNWVTYIMAQDVDAIAARAVELGGQVTMPVMDVMESGRMVGITDPTGAAIFFWQPKDFAGADVFGTHGSLVWNDLLTRDMAAAADFYEALLGWQVDRSGANDPNYWSITIDGEREGGIMLIGDQFPPEMPANWLIYFAADDARAIAERAAELGGRVETEPMEIPVAVFTVLSDPAGAPFAVMQMIPR